MNTKSPDDFLAKHEEWNNQRLEDILHSLLKITFDCRQDMHEPDEQSLSAKIVGKSFDNAVIDESEIALILTRPGKQVSINLCDLIALARKADPRMEVYICERCFKRVYPLLIIKIQDGSTERMCASCQREIPVGESSILGIV